MPLSTRALPFVAVLTLLGCIGKSDLHSGKAEICNNRVDDNGDGKTDCADPECLNFPGCCLDVCAAGSGMCDPTGVMRCEANPATGCLEYTHPAACQSGLVCTGGQCASSCTDQCTVGQKLCASVGSAVECKRASSGCAEWAPSQTCAIGQVCSGAQCVPVGSCTDQCVDGAQQCAANGLAQSCVRLGSGCTEWTLPASCAGGGSCQNGACANTCTPGQSQCVGGQAGVCGSNGQWALTACAGSQTCMNGVCIDPTCASGCTTPPGAGCLDPNTRLSYASTGTCVSGSCSYTTVAQACPYGCQQGACLAPAACTPNAARCNGSQIQQCNSNGSAWLFSQNCTGTCTSGLCDAPCTPGATRCNGGGVDTCNSAGTAWTPAASACGQGCFAGACMTDQLVVNGQTQPMEGEHHYSVSVVVKNGGQLQVPAGKQLVIYAPTITVEVSSSISATASGSTGCTAPPDDVAHGIRLVANHVTINGSLTFSGSGCAKDGLVVRADTIDGAGTVSSSARALLLYGTGGVAPGLSATSATQSLMPPSSITSSNYPEGHVYNDDGPPPMFTWDRPYATVTGYYYTVAGTSAVPTATSAYTATEVLAQTDAPHVGTVYLDVVTLDSNGVVGTVPHEISVTIVGDAPVLSSTTNPSPGTWYPSPMVVMAWDGGNPGVGYLHVMDNFPSTRPTPANGTFEPTNKSPAQVLLQNVPNGRWFFHMIARDSMGYSTKAATHYEVDLGTQPATGTVAGTVRDASDAGIVGATVVVQRGLYTTTTLAGGVYTFNNSIPAGSYEVVATRRGMKSQAATLTVAATQTAEANFSLELGTGCPTCADLCSPTACHGVSASCEPMSGTCEAGVCVGPNGPAMAVESGSAFTCAITSGGDVSCWGDNSAGELGDGTSDAHSSPMPASAVTGGVLSLSAGRNHACAVTSAGALVCWGLNDNGQLGNGGSTSSSSPVAVSGLGSGVDSVSAGSNHTCAVTKSGAVKCWGYNGYGQLGDGSTNSTPTPVLVPGLPPVVQVATSQTGSCAVTTSGGLKCWGYNGYGQLGDGTTTSHSSPVDVSGLASGVVAVSMTQYSTCAITAAGGVMCWGYNGYGLLGSGTSSNSSTPVAVNGLSSGVVAVTSGDLHHCALLGTGEARCWGYNGYGQLGNGSTSTSSVPVSVSPQTCGPSFSGLSAGGYHTCGLLSSGGVACWGQNSYGELGIGSTQTAYTPTAVTGF